MTFYVLLTCLAALGLAGTVWSGVRHRRVLAWDRELDVAFGSSERREVPRHRAL